MNIPFHFTGSTTGGPNGDGVFPFFDSSANGNLIYHALSASLSSYGLFTLTWDYYLIGWNISSDVACTIALGAYNTSGPTFTELWRSYGLQGGSDLQIGRGMQPNANGIFLPAGTIANTVGALKIVSASGTVNLAGDFEVIHVPKPQVG